MSKKLTQQQRESIAHSSLTYDQLTVKFQIYKKVVSKIKDEYGTKKGRSGNGGAINCKTTPEQRQEIIDSPLNPTELSKIYPLHPAYISRLRTEAGVRTGAGNYARNGQNSNKIDFTDEQMILVKDLSISAMQLEKMIGIANEIISRRRRELGLSYREYMKANKPEKKVRPRPMAKIGRPKKEKVIKVKVKKQLPVKVKKKVKKAETSIQVRETKFEIESKQMLKAKQAKDNYKLIEAKKIADGYRYVTRVGRFGIKETVLIKQ